MDEVTKAQIRHLKGGCEEMENSDNGGIPHFNVDAPVPKTKPAADSQVELPDGTTSFEFRLGDAQEPLLELRDDGKIFWMGREVTTDEELVNGMRDVLQSRTAAITFKEARKGMAKALRDDEGLMIGYVANVAMLVNDRYGITDHETRNQAAKDILHLIFESPKPMPLPADES